MSIEFYADNALNMFGKYFFIIMLTMHILYFCVLFGIAFVNVKYVTLLNIAVQSIICLFLMFRFHPFKKQHVLGKYDSKIIFSSSVILLTNLLFVEGVTQYFSVRTIVDHVKTFVEEKI